MSNLWTTASEATEEINHRKLFASLRVEAVEYWPFLAEAGNTNDFNNRLALISSELDRIVRNRTDNSATFTSARAELEASFTKDFATVEAARTIEGEYHYVKPAGGGKYKIVQKGTGKTLSTHDSKEEAESAFRGMEMHMHGAREDAERDSSHMVGSVCRGCGEPANKNDGKVTQRDLGSPEKWHKECYQMYNRRLKSNPNADKYHGASKLAADPGWISNDPDWWENKNKGGYGMPDSHPFWKEVQFEDIGQWRVFEKDGTWYAMNRNQNAWLDPKSRSFAGGGRQAIVDYVNQFNEKPVDIWASKTAADYQGDRAARVRGGATSVEQVQNYLPSNYTATQDPDGTIWISGHDSAGWTLDGYVIPRLQSGMISAVEIEGSGPNDPANANASFASKTSRGWYGNPNDNKCTVCGKPATKYVGGQEGYSASGHHVCDAHADHFNKSAAAEYYHAPHPDENEYEHGLCDRCGKVVEGNAVGRRDRRGAYCSKSCADADVESKIGSTKVAFPGDECFSCGYRGGEGGHDWDYSTGGAKCPSCGSYEVHDASLGHPNPDYTKTSAYQKGVDCANSGSWVKGDFKTGNGTAGDKVECTRCHKQVPLTGGTTLQGEKGAWMATHLKPGKSLSDRASKTATPAKFCGASCRSNFHSATSGGLLDPHSGPQKNAKGNCGYCGRPMHHTASEWQGEPSTTHFCAGCMANFGGDNPHANGGICPQCGRTAAEAYQEFQSRPDAKDWVLSSLHTADGACSYCADHVKDGDKCPKCGFTRQADLSDQQPSGPAVPGARPFLGEDPYAWSDLDYQEDDGKDPVEVDRMRALMLSSKTSAHDPVAYTYEADMHCPECAEKRFGPGAHGFDHEGNEVGAVAPWEREHVKGESCGTCHKRLGKLKAKDLDDNWINAVCQIGADCQKQHDKHHKHKHSKTYCPCGTCGKPCEVVGKLASRYECDECRGR
jgi:hypothetical protein